MKKLYILGASGSIGSQALEIIKDHNEYLLEGVSIGKNIPKLEEIIKNYHPKYICVQLEKDYLSLQKRYPHIKFFWGDNGLVELVEASSSQAVIINALVGMVGVKPTIAAISQKHTILLANKESLVVAGEIIMQMAQEENVNIIPIDSEHSAIFQCLSNRPLSEVKKIIITASGGSLRHLSREELKSVSIEKVLAHPNWSMGKKITVDSATMVNKGLEVIEAHHLFNLPYDKITTVLHPQSIVHSMVEFNDQSIIAQLSKPDMRIAIQYALTYPKKLKLETNASLDFNEVINLSFMELSYARFPMLELAYKVGRLGGLMPAIYNAANEEAVSLFLAQKIEFLDIEKIILNAVNNTKNINSPTLDDLLEVSFKIKQTIRKQYL